MSKTFDLDAFEDDVKIDEVNLDPAFRNQASLFAHYARMHSDAMRVAASKKLLRDVTEAQIDKEIRDAAVSATPPVKLTEAMIEKEITRHPKMIGACKALIEAEALAELAKNALKAFEQRKDMLVQLGADAREEMKRLAPVTKPISETLASLRTAN